MVDTDTDSLGYCNEAIRLLGYRLFWYCRVTFAVYVLKIIFSNVMYCVIGMGVER